MKFFRVEKNTALVVLAAAFIGFCLANSSLAGWMVNLASLPLPVASLNLNLSLQGWIEDFVLVGFFFLVGLELKHELVAGSLKNPARLLVPSLAAILGVAVPALTYIALTAGHPELFRGWPIPTATDVTFSLAVFLIFGSRMPKSARTFLLAFAIIDDMLAILIIAVFFGGSLNPVFLASAAFLALGFWYLAKIGANAWILVALGLCVWYLTLEGGIHPTIAGVALALLIPKDKLARTTELLHPWIGALVLPVFAFFAAAIPLAGIASALASPIFLAVMLRPLGKIIGVFSGAMIGVRVLGTRADQTVSKVDYLVTSTMGGIGFTVALLVSSLSFPPGSTERNSAAIATLFSALVSMGIAAVALRLRSQHLARQTPVSNQGLD